MLSLTFDAVQDRLLLEIKIEGKASFVWLTRRATLILSRVVEKLLVKMYAKSGITDVGDTIARFSQEALDTAYPPKRAAAVSTKSGLLASGVSSGIIGPTSARLTIKGAEGQSIQFVISRDLLHLLLNLLKLQAAKAEWKLEIGFSPVASGAAPTNLRQ